MFDRLEEVEKRYEEISGRLYDPQVIANQEEYRSLMREHKQLTPIVEAYRDYKKASENCAQAKAMMGDSALEKELRELAEEEWAQSKADMERIAEELKVLLLPHDPNDDKTSSWKPRRLPGGEEAALFSASLFRMYSMYAEQRGWKTEVISANETELGGYKEISFLISRGRSLFEAQIRKRGAPGSAGAGNRVPGPHSYLYGNGGGAAGSGGRGAGLKSRRFAD